MVIEAGGARMEVTGALAALIVRLLQSQAALEALAPLGHYQVRLHVEGGKCAKAQVLTALGRDGVQ